ncbi:MAG TPA: 23S rRNA (guanosine(2251)-2'-O)-methyltransferase RlmB [Solirubrobacteraceae bacterium]|jgi:23S rRNA (guanosine2251-2'-O)-methyltransferase|nr:23S rRNA (guanosine(2251)-2'-O)-methyltransferase RlmB [Solirubrobacteraceae bacterium]
MIVYGRNPVHELLRGRRAHTVQEVWATARAAREPWLGRRAQIVDPDQIEQRCGSTAHQGVCASAGGYPYVGVEELLQGAEPLLLALDQVQDPQNLGAVCRTAECTGFDGVIIPERRSAEITPAACKASAGAVEHLRVARVVNLSAFLARAQQAGCWCYGAAADGELAYDEVDYRGGVVLVLGGEGSGLRRRVAGACDARVRLPMAGRVRSLNVSAAASALMYEILQRRPGVDRTP